MCIRDSDSPTPQAPRNQHKVPRTETAEDPALPSPAPRQPLRGPRYTASPHTSRTSREGSAPAKRSSTRHQQMGTPCRNSRTSAASPLAAAPALPCSQDWAQASSHRLFHGHAACEPRHCSPCLSCQCKRSDQQSSARSHPVPGERPQRSPLCHRVSSRRAAPSAAAVSARGRPPGVAAAWRRRNTRTRRPAHDRRTSSAPRPSGRPTGTLPPPTACIHPDPGARAARRPSPHAWTACSRPRLEARAPAAHSAKPSVAPALVTDRS